MRHAHADAVRAKTSGGNPGDTTLDYLAPGR